MNRTFADRLARLFHDVRGPGGRRWENREVVDAINAAGQAKISASYLSELLSGKKDNPNIWTVKALADFFGQSVEYFVRDDPPVQGAGRLRPSAPEGTTTQADRVNLLFKTAGSPGTAQVVAAIAESAPTLTLSRLGAIRSGEADDLTTNEVVALAAYFEAPAAVLTDPQVAELLAAQLPAMTLLGDDTVRRIAFRARTLDPADREIVSGLLDRLTRTEPGMSPDELDF